MCRENIGVMGHVLWQNVIRKPKFWNVCMAYGDIGLLSAIEQLLTIEYRHSCGIRYTEESTVLLPFSWHMAKNAPFDLDLFQYLSKQDSTQCAAFKKSHCLKLVFGPRSSLASHSTQDVFTAIRITDNASKMQRSTPSPSSLVIQAAGTDQEHLLCKGGTTQLYNNASSKKLHIGKRLEEILDRLQKGDACFGRWFATAEVRGTEVQTGPRETQPKPHDQSGARRDRRLVRDIRSTSSGGGYWWTSVQEGDCNDFWVLSETLQDHLATRSMKSYWLKML